MFKNGAPSQRSVIRLGHVAVVSTSLAVASIAWADWSPPVKITGYYVYDAGSAYFTTTNNQNGENCQDNRYIALEVTAPNFKAIWAQLMAAHASDSTVSVRFLGCQGMYPKAIAVAIPQVW